MALIQNTIGASGRPYPQGEAVWFAEQLGGMDALTMGSDWRQTEETREPAEMYERVAGLSEVDRRALFGDKGRDLLGIH